MSLSNKDTSVVNGVSEIKLENSSLESSFHEFVNGQTEDVIELSFGFRKKSVLEHSSEKSRTFEESAGILGVEGQKFSGSLSEFGQDHLDSPDFSLVLQTESTNELESI